MNVGMYPRLVALVYGLLIGTAAAGAKPSDGHELPKVDKSKMLSSVTKAAAGPCRLNLPAPTRK